MTTLTVDHADDAGSRVTIATDIVRRPGVAGFLERLAEYAARSRPRR